VGRRTSCRGSEGGDGHVPVPDDRTPEPDLDQRLTPPREAPEALQDVIQARVRLELAAQPKFVASARGNRGQIEIRFRKLDHLPDAAVIAQRHDVVPPAWISRLLL